MDPGNPIAPRVWVLLGKGAGGNGQMLSLAEGLGWPYEAKQLVYTFLNLCPNMLLGASRMTLDRRRSSALEPPWPDLVIAASRRSAPVARWIKKKSAGHARLVHLLHAQAPLEHFDLVITTPQYRLPDRANVLHLSGALNRIDPERLVEAEARWKARFEHLPRPWIGLVVGGDSSSYEFDPQTAARLGREANDRAREEGGALLISTTPRTAPGSAKALFASIDCPAYRYTWRRDDPENPYLGYLALADRFIVTVDSASLPMEACATGKPVEVFEWPRRSGSRVRKTGDGGLSRFYDRLVYWGVVKPPRDFDAYHRALRERGTVSRLGELSSARPGRPRDDLAEAVSRIRALFGATPAA
jgi:mitochondrial fission protein ELM1